MGFYDVPLFVHASVKNVSTNTPTRYAQKSPKLNADCGPAAHLDFEKQEVLEAAELVAIDVLEPALRSRGGITDRSKQLWADEGFRKQMAALFKGDPSGRLVMRNIAAASNR